MRKQFAKNSGFTLVELAIVLVIIGLLVGGVLQGQELIKQAQIRNVLSTLNQYDAAVNTFRAKYNNALAGDFSRAAGFGLNVFPGTSTVNCSQTADTVVPTATAGCNGDNDGILEDSSGGNASVELDAEIANFWVQLANAALVKGSYSQATASTVVGVAYPKSTIGVGILALSEGRRLYYVIGVGTDIATNLQTETIGDNLSPAESYAIDSKLDDGLPTTGIVLSTSAFAADGTGFTTGTTGGAGVATCYNAGVYNYALGTKVCTIRVRASS